MLRKAQSLFEVFNVDEDADDEAVEERFRQHWMDAGCDYDAIPREIWDASRILRNGSLRCIYRDILASCYGRTELKVSPDDRNQLIAICQISQIRHFEHAKRPGVFEFRTASQANPRGFGDVDGFPCEPDPIPIRASRAIWRFVTFQVLIGTTPQQKLGFVVMYVAIVVGAVVAVPKAQEAIVEYREARRLQSLREDRAAAIKSLADLRFNVGAFASDFLDVTEVPIGSKQLTSTLEVAMLQHATVRDAWNAIHAHWISAGVLDDLEKRLAAISAGVDSRGAFESQHATLQGIVDELTRLQAALASHREDLNHIEYMLKANRARETNAAEGSMP